MTRVKWIKKKRRVSVVLIGSSTPDWKKCPSPHISISCFWSSFSKLPPFIKVFPPNPPSNLIGWLFNQNSYYPQIKSPLSSFFLWQDVNWYNLWICVRKNIFFTRRGSVGINWVWAALVIVVSVAFVIETQVMFFSLFLVGHCHCHVVTPFFFLALSYIYINSQCQIKKNKNVLYIRRVYPNKKIILLSLDPLGKERGEFFSSSHLFIFNIFFGTDQEENGSLSVHCDKKSFYVRGKMSSIITKASHYKSVHTFVVRIGVVLTMHSVKLYDIAWFNYLKKKTTSSRISHISIIILTSSYYLVLFLVSLCPLFKWCRNGLGKERIRIRRTIGLN